MKAKIYLTNGNFLQLDKYATKQVLKLVHEQHLNNSLSVLHVADYSGKLLYSIPFSSVSYIGYEGD